MEMEKQNSNHSGNLILYGIITGVITGFLLGWFTGPLLVDTLNLQHRTLLKGLELFDLNQDDFLSQKEGRFLGNYFSKFDKNGDKKINLQEEFPPSVYQHMPFLEQKLLRKIIKKRLKKLSQKEKVFSITKRLAEERRQAILEQETKSSWILFLYEMLDLFGELFLNALKMLIVPLIITSMIGGVTALGDIRKLGKVGIYTVAYYMVTTAFAVIAGLILVTIVQPGVGIAKAAAVAMPPEKELSFFEVIKGFVHPNIFGAMVEMKILPIIIFSLILGGILTTMGKKSETTLDVIHCLGDAIMKFVMLIMYFAPFGIFGLLAFKVGMAGGKEGFGSELSKLAKYAFTVIFGLLIHGLVILPSIYYVLTRKNPFSFLKGMIQALVTAFSTASSSATLPLTMECVEQNNGVSNRAASFVLPLGATINMDGTALYEAVAAMFIAQVYGISIGFGGQIMVFMTATLAAIGAAGIPEAGLVTMIVVLEAVGIPIEGISLLLVIDWFLDRCRTTINVWGDSLGAGIIDHLVIKEE